MGGQFFDADPQAEVAKAVTGNAANLISFRVGIADAMALALKFEPGLSPKDLMRLPNYTAAGTLLQGATPSAPVVFATEPEPKAPSAPRARSSRGAAPAASAAPTGIRA